jgi:hypothetical protein
MLANFGEKLQETKMGRGDFAPTVERAAVEWFGGRLYPASIWTFRESQSPLFMDSRCLVTRPLPAIASSGTVRPDIYFPTIMRNSVVLPAPFGPTRPPSSRVQLERRVAGYELTAVLLADVGKRNHSGKPVLRGAGLHTLGRSATLRDRAASRNATTFGALPTSRDKSQML